MPGRSSPGGSGAAASVAEWILGFEVPKAACESGVMGLHLARALRDHGASCVVGPASDKRRKSDRSDAEFLTRRLLAHNVVETFAPDKQTEGARCLPRAIEDLVRARHRLTHLLIRWGWAWNERTLAGGRKGAWTRAHWEWVSIAPSLRILEWALLRARVPSSCRRYAPEASVIRLIS